MMHLVQPVRLANLYIELMDDSWARSMRGRLCFLLGIIDAGSGEFFLRNAELFWLTLIFVLLCHCAVNRRSGGLLRLALANSAQTTLVTLTFCFVIY